MFDVRSMVVMLLLSTATTAIFTLLAQRGQQRLQGLNLWAWAHVILTTGLVLIALRDRIADLWSIGLANPLLFFSLMLMGSAVVSILELGSRNRRILWALTAIASISFVSAYALGLDYHRRVLLLSFLLSLQCGFVSGLLLYKCGPTEPARRALGVSFTLLFALMLARVAIGGAGQFNAQRLDDHHGADAIFYLFIFVLLFGNAIGFILMARERLLHDLALRATTDALTGVYNRHAFEPIASSALALIDRHNLPVSLLMIDLDHFKAINDRYGHLAGDQALKAISQVIRHELRGGDALARYGGEELSLLLPGSNAEAAKRTAERIRDCIETTVIPWRNDTIKLTASIGFATATQRECLADVIDAADRAMYAAKKAGRNQTCQGEIKRDDLKVSHASAGPRHRN